MSKTKFARIAYSASWNLGDHIQTLATERFLGDKPINIEREKLDCYDGELAKLVMQGYFFENEAQCSFPPSEKIKPVFFGFHIEDTSRTRKRYSQPDIINYLKRFTPIGCRDKSTMLFLQNHSVDAYFSRCLTLTFDRRSDNIKGDTVFFIDEPEWLKSSSVFGKRFSRLYDNAEFLTQVIDNVEEESDSAKRDIAIRRLQMLKLRAKLVVTSRLHVASPCLAMGIPVILIPREVTPVRYEAIEGLLPIYITPTRYFKRLGRYGLKLRRIMQILYVRFIINWNPKAYDIEILKRVMIRKLEERMKEM